MSHLSWVTRPTTAPARLTGTCPGTASGTVEVVQVGVGKAVLGSIQGAGAAGTCPGIANGTYARVPPGLASTHL